VRHFFANVAGESFCNDDGSDRQPIIASCRVGEALILDAEPDNPEDENAIRVLRLDGKQIGYIERDMAARLVDDLTDFRAFIAGIGRGGGPGYLGVSLLMVVNDGADDAVVNAYARRVLEAEGNLGRSTVQQGAPGRSHQRRRWTRRAASREETPDRGVPWRWAVLSLAGTAAAAAAFWWFVMAP
jgi:hypothetical protein